MKSHLIYKHLLFIIVLSKICSNSDHFKERYVFSPSVYFLATARHTILSIYNTSILYYYYSNMRDAKFMKGVHFNNDGMIMCYTSGIAYSVVQHILCCVFALFVVVLCTLCCQFLWIVHVLLLVRYCVFFKFFFLFWNRLFMSIMRINHVFCIWATYEGMPYPWNGDIWTVVVTIAITTKSATKWETVA